MALPCIEFGPNADWDTWQSVVADWVVEVETKTGKTTGQIKSVDGDGLVISPVWDDEVKDWDTERFVLIWDSNIVRVSVI